MLHPAIEHTFRRGCMPTSTYGFTNMISPEICLDIIRKADLKSKYPKPSNTDIIDVYSGVGTFSAVLNAELRPRSHVLLEKNLQFVDLWKQRLDLLSNAKNLDYDPNFKLKKLSGYLWDSYTTIIKEKLVTPEFQPRDRVHDELLVVGNLTSTMGESLFTQWIMCCAYGNWVQKYGRVRMICMVPETTAVRILAGDGYNKRNKSAVKREFYTDAKLLAVSDEKLTTTGISAAGAGIDPRLLYRDQPLVVSRRDLAPSTGSIAVVEVVPRPLPKHDIQLLDFMLLPLMLLSGVPVAKLFASVYHGTSSLVLQIPPEIAEKEGKYLTTDEILVLLDILYKWPFKPTDDDMATQDIPLGE